MKRTAALALALVPFLLPTASAQDVLRRPQGPSVRATHLVASVEIVDGIATTKLTQTLRNDGGGQAEATWILPLPEGAVADQFKMTVNGVPTIGEVLDATNARNVYENIVRRRRDPGLLEYMGRGCLRARVFPIPPGGDVRVEVGFRQILPRRGGLYDWSFALAAAGIEGKPPEHVVLDLSLTSQHSIHNVFSPTAGVEVLKKSDHEARASFEGAAAAIPDRELSVFYGLSEADFGLNLLTHRKAGQDEGTFMMLISPKRDWSEARVMKKVVTFVLDTSGSMNGRKIEQAKGALRFFLNSLRPEDRFAVVPFATEPVPFFPEPVVASPANVSAALAKVEAITAVGGTNIDQALQLALAGLREPGEHVPILVFVTDGLPTVGESGVDAILARAKASNPGRARLFAFGVGDDVNTHLLDELAAQNGGTRNYVREHEDIEVETGDLLTKITHPVMTDLALSVDRFLPGTETAGDTTGITISKIVPERLPDLFQGGQIAVFGRYVGSGPRAIRLSGTVSGERRDLVFEGTFSAEPVARHDFVASFWAERRVGVLLDAIRLNGPHAELLAEVQRLGREYRIVTPYTSHLIVEDGLRIGAIPPGAGGGGGGGGPASPGPAGPGTPGVLTGSDEFFLGSRQRGQSPPTLASIALRLRDAGVLPDDASEEELTALAADLAGEMREADAALRGLSLNETGKSAVDDSVYLAGLIRRAEVGGRADSYFLGRGEKKKDGELALDLFTRKVRDKVFHLRKGVWFDRECTETLAAAKRTVEAYSDEYFELLAKVPALAPYFAFSPRVVVVIDGAAYEVTPPSDAEDR